MGRVGLGVMLVAALAAVGAVAPAGALGAANVTQSGSTLLYEGTSLRDQPTVTFLPNATGTADDQLRIREENGDNLTEFAQGCAEANRVVTCDATFIQFIRIDVKASDDTVKVDTSVTINALILGGSGFDRLTGGNGSDSIVDHDSNRFDLGQLLDGRGGNDTLDASGAGRRDGDAFETHNLLVGGPGSDSLTGGPGPDALRGDAGNDTLDGGPGADRLEGGGDTDTITYQHHSTAVSVDPTFGVRDDGSFQEDSSPPDSGARDTVNNDAENLTGGPGSDTLRANEGANLLRGLGGNDTLDGRGGDDTLEGGAGFDSLFGRFGTDTASYADHTAGVVVAINSPGPGDTEGNPVGPSVDNVSFTIENLRGGTGSDVLNGNGFKNRLRGNAGNDTLNGFGSIADPDELEGESGDDFLQNGSGRTIFSGGPGVDTADYSAATARLVVDIDDVADDGPDTDGNGASNENDNVRQDTEGIQGGSAADALTGGDAANTLVGNGGDDLLLGGGGDDTFDGGQGADRHGGGPGVDTISYAGRVNPVTVDPDDVADDGEAGEGDNAGGGGVENITGGNGNDTLTGTAVNNRIVGGFGADTLNGLGGDDRLETVDFGATAAFRDVVACGDGAADVAVVDLQDVPPGFTVVPPVGGGRPQGAAAEDFVDCENTFQAPIDSHPTVQIFRGAVRASASGLVAVRLTCPRVLRRRCAGTLSFGTRSGRVTAARGRSYSIRFGRRTTYRFALTAAERRTLAARGRLVARVVTRERDRRGRPKVAIATFRVNRARPRRR